MIPDNLKEPPCSACGAENTGGNLRSHNPGCPYITRLCEDYPAIRAFVELRDTEPHRKGPRKNSKH